jgi:hypothetical protein
MFRGIGDRSGDEVLLQVGASLMLLEGRPADAARLLGALQAKLDRGGPLLAPSQAVGLPDPDVGARAALPAAEFEAAFEDGRSWSPSRRSISPRAEPRAGLAQILSHSTISRSGFSAA